MRRGGTSPAAESRVLKAKGLPWRLSEAELCQFFQDFALLRVVLLPTADGRPSGMAFAEFETPEEAVRAMTTRNGDFIGDRYVKLLRVPHEEMEEQAAGLIATPAAGHTSNSAAAVAALNFQALGLNGPSSYASQQAQAAQLQQLQQLQHAQQAQAAQQVAHQAAQQAVQQQEALRAGLAAQAQQAQQQAQQDHNNQQQAAPPLSQPLSSSELNATPPSTEASAPTNDVPTTMWGSAFPTATSSAFQNNANGLAFPSANGNGGAFPTSNGDQLGGLGGCGTGWDPMRNGPQPFLGGISYPHLLGSFGSGNGLGGANWGSGSGGLPELPPDNGEKPISVLIEEQQEAIRAAQRAAAAAAAAAPSYQQALGNSPLFQQQQRQQQQLQQAQQAQQAVAFQNLGPSSNIGVGSAPNLGAPPFQSATDQQMGLAMQRAASAHGVSPPLPPLGNPQHMMHGLQQYPSGNFAGGGAPGGGSSSGPVRLSPTRLVKTDGSTLKVRGLPFRATPEEILAFFDGFKVVEGSLHLGSDGRGRPSGEGWLTFETAEEARAVARAKNKQFMGKRYLELSLC
eukprot:CAMPEP_0206140144 /NCGR_PEP_ID=MMETSP1473-20131121/8553_1 /ASSEMBLY_ACC=CAM_ASM_001109 /TAXON_ID=1461547 /ORGANISM="Stichococcus sp, Strain RCC1054" /LENGTH=567 /DNA_ID=CAMNT_0053534191 /DNA_START=347 /DNA_END=2050 /DNA_ORIENTATION=-